MLRLPELAVPDPRHRYHDIARQARAPRTDYERALLHVLTAGRTGSASIDADVLAHVRAACLSFQLETARVLFDASLLGGADVATLRDTFNVTAGEGAAYAHLFFDRSVFLNELHVLHYIAQQPDSPAKEALREAYTRGFDAIRARYAPETSLSPADVLEGVLHSEAQLYYKNRNADLHSKSAKEVRALGKMVVATAQAVTKLRAPVAPAAGGESPEATGDSAHEFVLQSGEPNPTLEELLAAGAKMAH